MPINGIDKISPAVDTKPMPRRIANIAHTIWLLENNQIINTMSPIPVAMPSIIDFFVRSFNKGFSDLENLFTSISGGV